MISLDIFYMTMQNKPIETMLEAWLTFLACDHPERIIELITRYPEFKPLYETLYQMCQNVKGVMGFFSEELRIMDQNLVQYMIEEQQKEIEESERIIKELKEEKEDIRKEIEASKREAEASKKIIKEKDEMIKKLMKELEKASEFGSTKTGRNSSACLLHYSGRKLMPREERRYPFKCFKYVLIQKYADSDKLTLFFEYILYDIQ